jgi:hypothetical protein
MIPTERTMPPAFAPRRTRFLSRCLLALGAMSVFCPEASALDVLALGTSNTNCRGANQAFTRRLNELLASDQIRVINGGENGDKPVWMLARLKAALGANPDIRMVLFEPGPNERVKEYSIKPTSEILEFLRLRNIPTIYTSHIVVQDNIEAAEFAERHGAYYYGNWTRGMPEDRLHRQYDMGPGNAGHMTEFGCRRWAEQMAPLIREVADKTGLREIARH